MVLDDTIGEAVVRVHIFIDALCPFEVALFARLLVEAGSENHGRTIGARRLVASVARLVLVPVQSAAVYVAPSADDVVEECYHLVPVLALDAGAEVAGPQQGQCHPLHVVVEVVDERVAVACLGAVDHLGEFGETLRLARAPIVVDVVVDSMCCPPVAAPVFVALAGIYRPVAYPVDARIVLVALQLLLAEL